MLSGSSLVICAICFKLKPVGLLFKYFDHDTSNAFFISLASSLAQELAMSISQ